MMKGLPDCLTILVTITIFWAITVTSIYALWFDPNAAEYQAALPFKIVIQLIYLWIAGFASFAVLVIGVAISPRR